MTAIDVSNHVKTHCHKITLHSFYNLFYDGFGPSMSFARPKISLDIKCQRFYRLNWAGQIIPWNISSLCIGSVEALFISTDQDSILTPDKRPKCECPILCYRYVRCQNSWKTYGPEASIWHACEYSIFSKCWMSEFKPFLLCYITVWVAYSHGTFMSPFLSGTHWYEHTTWPYFIAKNKITGNIHLLAGVVAPSLGQVVFVRSIRLAIFLTWDSFSITELMLWHQVEYWRKSVSTKSEKHRLS